MAVSLNTTLRSNRADAITTFAGNGAKLRIYTSGAVQLVECVCGTPFAGSASSGVLTLSSITAGTAANPSNNIIKFNNLYGANISDFVTANSTEIIYDGLINLNSLSSSVRVGNSTVNSFIDSSSLKTDSANFTSQINVGSELSLNTTSIQLGNSTSNVLVINSLISLSNSTSTSNITPTDLTIGATVVNSSIVYAGIGSFTSYANVGSNVFVNTSAVFIGNSTANLISDSQLISISNSTSTANLTPSSLRIGSAIVNSTVLTIGTGNFSTGANVGANVNLTTSSVQIGNSTVNTQVNSSVISKIGRAHV